MRKELPDTLNINIQEHIPLARININGKYFTFTSRGYILEKGSLNARLDVPEIKRNEV